MKINDLINEQRVVIVQTGFKGMVDTVSAITDMLIQTAELTPEDREVMSAMATRVMRLAKNDLTDPVSDLIDPALMGLILLQLGSTLLEMCPNYVFAEVMERNPCPDASPLN